MELATNIADIPHNVPAALTSFIGREHELLQISRLLRTSRLLTLTGPGGCGKTRLALEACPDLLAAFPDGIWQVELAALKDPALLPGHIAAALGLREKPGSPVRTGLTEFLRDRRILLLLDNAEHLAEAAAELVDHLLHRCPALRVLCTSRHPLAIAGETVLSVPPLPAPESVRLFVERAAAALPGFALTPDDAESAARICRRLDGIPLAIELAARRVSLLSPREIELRLDDRFRLLTHGSRGGLVRHITLQAALDWSYLLLAEPERILWQRLSVFGGDFALPAVEGVCAGAPIAPGEMLDLLGQLVDKSVVTVIDRNGARRYRLLETIRQFGLERLDQSGSAAAWRCRHLHWYVAFAEAARPHLDGPEQLAWLDRLESEHHELRQALAWSKSAPDLAGDGLRLCNALGKFWDVRGYWSEGRAHLAGLLALPADGAPDRVRARALSHAGTLAWRQGDYAAGGAYYTEALAGYRALGDRHGAAGMLMGLGNIRTETGAHAEAAALYQEALAIYRSLGKRFDTAIALNNLGNLSEHLGDYTGAIRHYQESLAVKQELGNMRSAAWTRMNLGYVHLKMDDLAGARTHLTESLAVFREHGDKTGMIWSLTHLGSVLTAEGDLTGARACCEESLALGEELGHKLGIGSALHGLAVLALAGGDPAAAYGPAKRALALFGDAGYPEGIRTALTDLAQVMAAAGRSEAAARLRDWAADRTMTPAECLAFLDGQEPVVGAPPRGTGLTPRETAIVRLIARGLTAKEMGAQLYLSPRTVQKHEENIRAKLGLTNRASLAAWAVAHGLAE